MKRLLLALPIIALITACNKEPGEGGKAEIRGRVMSVLNVLLGLLYPIGAVVQGRLSDSIGQRIVTAGAAILMLAVLVLLSVLQPGLFRRLETPAASATDASPLPAPT